MSTKKGEAPAGPQGGRTTILKSGLLRKSCYFHPDEWRAVRRRAFEEETSAAEIIRAAVRAYLGVEP